MQPIFFIAFFLLCINMWFELQIKTIKRKTVFFFFLPFFLCVSACVRLVVCWNRLLFCLSVSVSFPLSGPPSVNLSPVHTSTPHIEYFILRLYKVFIIRVVSYFYLIWHALSIFLPLHFQQHPLKFI